MPAPISGVDISTTLDMEKVSELLDEVYENSNKFVRSHTKAAKLEIYERITNVISSGISAGIVITLLMLTLFFINLGLAYWIGDLIQNRSLGYVIVGGFYFLALLIYLLLRNRVASNIVKNAVLKKVSKTHDDFDELLEEQEVVASSIQESMVAIRDNFNDIKEVIVGKNKPKQGEDPTQTMVNTAVNYAFQNVIFKKGGFVKKTVLPIVANTLVNTFLFKESKAKSLWQSVKSRLMKRFSPKPG